MGEQRGEGAQVLTTLHRSGNARSGLAGCRNRSSMNWLQVCKRHRSNTAWLGTQPPTSSGNQAG
jgi:hypothetical protein